MLHNPFTTGKEIGTNKVGTAGAPVWVPRFSRRLFAKLTVDDSFWPILEVKFRWSDHIPARTRADVSHAMLR